MRVKITDFAKTDLEQGYFFYEQQQVGLDTYFLKNWGQTPFYSIPYYSKACICGQKNKMVSDPNGTYLSSYIPINQGQATEYTWKSSW